MKNRRSAKIRRGRSPGFMYASARSRFAAMRMEFLLFDLGEWLDAGVNNYAKAQEESWQCSSRRRGGSLTRRGKKFSACSSLGEGEGSSLGEKVDREMDGKKRGEISRGKLWKRHSRGRCSSFSSGGNLFGILSLRGLLVVERFEIIVYLFICSKGVIGSEFGVGLF